MLALQILWSRWGGPGAIKGGLPEGLAVCFCGRHAGDQGSERTDWAGLEPPRSPGTLLFNHSEAKQSDGELHMPLVSLVSLSLCLHLCLSRSASLRFLSSLLSVLMLLLLISPCFFFLGPLMDFVVNLKLQPLCIF